jgi:hypothetical protein
MDITPDRQNQRQSGAKIPFLCQLELDGFDFKGS